MKSQKFGEQFATMFGLAVKLAGVMEADAIMVLVAGKTDWEQMQKLAGKLHLLVVAENPEHTTGAADLGLDLIILDGADTPVHDRISQALLKSVAEEILSPGASVIAVYSGFDPARIDSVSYVQLEIHLGQLTSRDLRQLANRVPLDTLKLVVDLAVDIGREGREGKPVGTLFIVGDTRKVLQNSHAIGLDPVKGYNRKERNLRDPRVREGLKEVALMDGAFLVSSDGTVEAACRYIDASAENISLSKGLGSRHWAAAAITKKTTAIAVAVSESNGTVRIFQDGEIVLRVEPFRRAMKWKDFDHEPPSSSSDAK
ncbi:MAG: DNA integrity scanning protein DisA nucleotide-binding domain protein [Planctomycetales bacterium]|nr:DNA integrity scanning protein DisA nucleotide-binding domain protein [Planctomycetales bacterium]